MISPLLASSPGTYKQGEDINLIQTCADCTYINITSINLPNGTQIIGNVPMTKDGSVFNYVLNGSLTNSLGTYRVNGIGDPIGVNEIWAYEFYITYSGIQFSTAQSVLLGILLIIMIFVFISTFFGIGMLPGSNTRDEEGKILSISYLKYLRSTLWFAEWMLFIGILYISSNVAFAYLGEELIAQTFFTIFKITFGVTPVIVIVWFAWLLVKIVQDRQLMREMERGVFGNRL